MSNMYQWDEPGREFSAAANPQIIRMHNEMAIDGKIFHKLASPVEVRSAERPAYPTNGHRTVFAQSHDSSDVRFSTISRASKSHLDHFEGASNPKYQLRHTFQDMESTSSTNGGWSDKRPPIAILKSSDGQAASEPLQSRASRYRLVQVERQAAFGDESSQAGIGLILDKDFTSDELFIFHLQYGSPALDTGLLSIGGETSRTRHTVESTARPQQRRTHPREPGETLRETTASNSGASRATLTGGGRLPAVSPCHVVKPRRLTAVPPKVLDTGRRSPAVSRCRPARPASRQTPLPVGRGARRERRVKRCAEGGGTGPHPPPRRAAQTWCWRSGGPRPPA